MSNASTGPETAPPRTAELSTVSVRTRVTAAVIAVVTVTLALVTLVVSTVFAAQSERSLDTLLAGRVQLARQLARNGAGPQQIVNRVGTTGVQAALVLGNGTSFGTTATGPDVRSVEVRLNGPGRVDGAVLTVALDTTLVRAGQNQLQRVLIVTSIAAVLVSAVLVLFTVRLALRPLDAVAGLARSITRGHRGSRLRPRRTDTEIGQTAAALDEMLDELEGAEARARQAEQRTRTFLADAAHELRTPLTGIQAAAETLLHSGAQLDSGQREQLEALLVREAQRSGTLVADLLAAARLDAGVGSGADRPRSAVSLAALAWPEVERARLRVPRASVSQSGVDTVVTGDPDQLSGIVRNLMDNAVRAAGPDGAVHVRIGTVRIGTVRFDSGGPGDDWAFLDVIDSGPGVPSVDRERIFDRMVRLDASRGRDGDAGGSGLGLAIARGNARAHGGDLVCLDRDDGLPGARFRLRLPLTPG